MVVPILAQDAVAVAFGVFELPRPQCPKEGQQTKPAKNKRYWDQDGEHFHGEPYFSLRALSVTVSEEVDMASAAISGVARPASATGTAITL